MRPPELSRIANAVNGAVAHLGGPDAVIARLATPRARADAAAPTVRLIRGDAVLIEPIQWAWRGYLPAGKLVIFGGAPGCGKTTIAIALGAVQSSGGSWPDGTSCRDPGDVLIWSGEDDAGSTLAPRLLAAGADMTRVHFVDGITGGDGKDAFDPARDMPLLEAEAAKLKAPRLLIIDPIVSAVAGDAHRGNEVRRSLQPIVDLAQRLGCAVIGITHFTKGTQGRDPVERITASLSFGALARVVWVAAKVKSGENDEPRRVFVRAKSNIGPDGGGFAYELEQVEVKTGVEGQKVKWLEALEGSAREVLAEAEAEQENDDGSSAAGVDGFLRGLLADGPAPAKAIKADADGAGFAWRTVQLSATRLGVERRKEGMKGGWMWALTGPEQPRRRSEGAEDATQIVLAPSAPSAAPSDDGEAF